MIISDITLPIPIEAIYPDRLTLQCEFRPLHHVPMPVYWQRLQRCLRRSSARITCWRRREFELDIRYEGQIVTVKCKLLCPGPNKPLYLYFSFNPITLSNQRRGIYVSDNGSAERPFVAVNNYLREGDHTTPLGVMREVDAFAVIVQDQLIELIDSFYHQFSPVPVTYCHMQIQNIETMVDLLSTGVGNTVQLFSQIFPSAFKRTRNRTFRSSECVFGSDEAVQFVEGHYRSGVRAKLYEKTNRRIRAEISFTKKALKYRSIDTRIVGDNNFADVFPVIAQLVQPIFQSFLTPLSTTNDDALTVADIEAFAAIVARASPANAINVMNRLTNLPCITTASMTRARREQLLNAGILDRIDRGLFQLNPRYRQAIERIQNALATNDEAA